MAETEQIKISNIIDKDIVKIATSYSDYAVLNPELVKNLLVTIKNLEEENLSYIQNEELIDIFRILLSEFSNSYTAVNISFSVSLEYLLTAQSFEKNLVLRIITLSPKENIEEAFSLLIRVFKTPQKIFEKIFIYLFNEDFLDLEEDKQIEYIYKVWNTSLSLFNDNEAFNFAYIKLLKLFHQALHYKKTEVAFWLYYNPLHYFKTGTTSNIELSNEEFKNEVEKPLEKYILEILVPKYNLIPNNNKINENKKIKVAFVMQRIIRHSTINVFYSLIKNILHEKNENFEFIIYDLSFPELKGSNTKYVNEFKELGIKYVNIHKKIFPKIEPTYSLLKKCIETRRILIDDEIDVLIGLHTRVEYIFLYATRTAPKQIYWYHSSNAQYDVIGIDKRIGHGHKRANIDNFDIYMDKEKFYSKDINLKILKEERAKYPNKTIIIGTVGRLIKLSDEYIDTIIDIMIKVPNSIYIAAGNGDKNKIIKRIKNLNIKNRFYFPGFVNSHLYSEIIDFTPDTFPINQGESLQEFMNQKEINSFCTLVNSDFFKKYKEELSIMENRDKILSKDKKFKENNDYIKSKYKSPAYLINITDNINEYKEKCLMNINDIELKKAFNYNYNKYIEFESNKLTNNFTTLIME